MRYELHVPPHAAMDFFSLLLFSFLIFLFFFFNFYHCSRRDDEWRPIFLYSTPNNRARAHDGQSAGTLRGMKVGMGVDRIERNSVVTPSAAYTAIRALSGFGYLCL